VKSLTYGSLVLALIPSLSLFCAPQAASQANTTPEPVKVVNTIKNPVPTVAQGTTKILGNVHVTNSSLPVTGSVSITNSNVPVTVSNTPLPVEGTVNIAPDTAQYKYQLVMGYPCNNNSNGSAQDFCTLPINQQGSVSVESVLNSYSSQGYELFSVTEAGGATSSNPEAPWLVYTLRAPVQGARRKPSRVQ
jgi:hypothetical protein